MTHIFSIERGMQTNKVLHFTQRVPKGLIDHTVEKVWCQVQ